MERIAGDAEICARLPKLGVNLSEIGISVDLSAQEKENDDAVRKAREQEENEAQEVEKERKKKENETDKREKEKKEQKEKESQKERERAIQEEKQREKEKEASRVVEGYLTKDDVPDKEEDNTHFSQWKGDTAGGCFNYRCVLHI